MLKEACAGDYWSRRKWAVGGERGPHLQRSPPSSRGEDLERHLLHGAGLDCVMMVSQVLFVCQIMQMNFLQRFELPLFVITVNIMPSKADSHTPEFWPTRFQLSCLLVASLLCVMPSLLPWL